MQAAEEDYVFGNLAYEAERRMELLSKQLRVRIAKWLEFLSRAQVRMSPPPGIWEGGSYGRHDDDPRDAGHSPPLPFFPFLSR